MGTNSDGTSGKTGNVSKKSIFSYYKPYKKLFFGDMFCAFMEALATLIIPLIIRYITGTVVNEPFSEALPEIYKLGAVMIGLCLVQFVCQWYTVYFGHMVGTFQERDMRSALMK